MALVTIFAIVTIIITVRRKEWFLAIMATITGLLLASTGTEFGTKAVEILTTVSKTVDGLFK